MQSEEDIRRIFPEAVFMPTMPCPIGQKVRHIDHASLGIGKIIGVAPSSRESRPIHGICCSDCKHTFTIKSEDTFWLVQYDEWDFDGNRTHKIKPGEKSKNPFVCCDYPPALMPI